MKTPNRIIVYILISLSCVTLISAQWKLISGPQGNFSNFAFLGSKMYAGSDNLSLTTDQGISWTSFSWSQTVYSLMISADSSDTTIADFFIGTLSNSIYRSTDFGITFTPSNSGISYPYAKVNALLSVSDGKGGRILFAGLGLLGGIYRSTDNGVNWTRHDAGIALPDIRSLTSIDSIIYAGTADSGAYHSTDWGINWSPANTGIENTTVNSFASRPINGGVDGWYLYAATDLGLYFTTNMGTTWSLTSSVGTRNVITSVAISPDSSYTIVAGTYTEGLYRSTNNGASWEPINEGLPTNRPLTAGPVAFHSTPNGLNLFASVGLIYKSTDYGSTWQVVSSGLSNTTVYSIAKSPDGRGGEEVLAGTNGNGIFRSPNGGKSWYPAETDPGSYYFIFDFAWTKSTSLSSSEYVFAAAGQYSPGVFRSSDDGIGWNYVNSGLPPGAEVRCLDVIDPPNGSEPTRVFAGTYAGVYLTTNFGGTWTEADSGLTNKVIYSVVSYKTTMFVATDGGVFESTNSGTSWSPANSGLTSAVSHLAIIAPLGCSNDWILFAGGGNSIYRSTNQGDDWSGIVSPLLPGASLISLVPYTSHGGKYLFASAFPNAPNVPYLYVTSDLGATWDSVSTGITSPNYIISVLDVGDDLLASTGIGVWRRPLSEMITRAIGSDISTKKHWNLVSIPVLTADSSSGSIFPCAIDSIYGYDGSNYVVNNYLSHGGGYWARFSDDHDFFIGGIPVAQETVGVHTGWNLVGSISSAIPVSAISSEPPDLTLSNFFDYDGIYNRADILLPTLGYWVKANQPGTLILSPSPTPGRATRKVRIVSTSELPPLPPGVESSVLKHQLPARFALLQNYPNPFNPTTMLKYDLPMLSHVKLRIYDVLGQLVVNLVDELQEAGTKSVEWDASKTASGLYFYRIEIQSKEDPSVSFTEVKKMLLIR